MLTYDLPLSGGIPRQTGPVKNGVFKRGGSPAFLKFPPPLTKGGGPRGRVTT